MSQVTYPKVQVAVRHHWVLVLSALLALAATIAVVLVISIGSESTGAQAISEPVSGPNESNVAAAVGARPSPAPDESSIASSVGSGQSQPSGPSESSIASSLGR